MIDNTGLVSSLTNANIHLLDEIKYLKSIRGINSSILVLPEDKKELISDGYHTFKELYVHRIALFVALCNILNELDATICDIPGAMYSPQKYYVWKSKLHADGTMYDGFFIAGIGIKKGETLTYHLPISEWNKLNSYELEKAPEFDGHTSEDIIRLLNNL